MAVAHVASATASTTNPSSTMAITIPTVSAGDVLFCFFVSDGGGHSISDNDTGGNTWTEVVFDSDGSVISRLYYKYATSGSSGKVITISDDGTKMAGGVSAYSGAHATLPYSNVSATTEVASGTESVPGFTPTTAGSMICFAVGQASNDNAVSSQACTNPGALTQRFEKLSTAGTDTGANHASALQAAGPTATGAFTWAQTDGATKVILWAIPPAAGGNPWYHNAQQ